MSGYAASPLGGGPCGRCPSAGAGEPLESRALGLLRSEPYGVLKELVSVGRLVRPADI